MGIKSITLAVTALVLSTTASAALVERLGGLAYYDDVANLTWLADANYAMTSGYDVDGLMNWYDSMAWAALSCARTLKGFSPAISIRMASSRSAAATAAWSISEALRFAMGSL